MVQNYFLRKKLCNFNFIFINQNFNYSRIIDINNYKNEDIKNYYIIKIFKF